MNTQGKVFKYPDNVDTDVIIPARYLNTPNAQELALHCMEDIDKAFVKKVEKGDVIVAGWNFGCGSSREHAPLAIKTAGISVVIAKSFARIFYRNAFNMGLLLMEVGDEVDKLNDGDELEIDAATGRIRDLTNGAEITCPPLPPSMVAILAKGGLVGYVKERLAKA